MSRVSGIALRTRRWRAAGVAAVIATRAAPKRADGWMALARVCRLGSGSGLVNDPIRGLEPGATGDLDRAKAAAREAVLAEPVRSDAHVELAQVLVAAGQLTPAGSVLQTATTIDPASAEAWFQRSRLQAERAAQDGLYTAAGFDAHRRFALKALECDPHHVHARYHLIRVALRAADWPTAIDAAVSGPVPVWLARLFEPDPVEEDVMTVLDAAGGGRAWDGLDNDAWLVAFWRLLDLSRPRQAFAVKDRFARGILARRSASGAVAETVARARALACLSEHDAAIDDIADALRHRRDGRGDAALTKLWSDVSLLTGDLDRHRLREPEPGLGLAEARFDDLIRGRRVAIVGPTSTEPNATFDDVDVVIRPKSLGEEDAGRADIAYFANAGARILEPAIGAALSDGRLLMAVVRPSLAERAGAMQVPPGTLRVAPRECAALLEASQYGIPRIVYDVLRYAPEYVRVVNTDFFASGRRYDAGYHVERDYGFRERVVGYGHDLRADHAAMSALLESGAIDADDTVRDVLSMSTPDYLDRVGTAGSTDA